MSGDINVPAKEIVANYDLTLAQVLTAAGIEDGDGDTLVSLSVVLAVHDLESLEVQEKNRASGPPRLSRQDRQRLVDLQQWANDRRGVTIPADAQPERVESLGQSGKVRYWLMGREFYMPATQFTVAQRGECPFIGVGEQVFPKHGEVVEKAKLLKSIMLPLHPSCELCGDEIEDYSPELAMVYEMLRGGVLADSGLRPVRGQGEFSIHYRRMHLMCRLWDRAYQQVVVMCATSATEDEIVAALQEQSTFVLQKAQEKRPETTLIDVLMRLKKIDEYLLKKYSTRAEG